jgi:pyruvate/2-oxoglutarate dehydrogenase complex dihydrolipoamide acyltransferase (E2) component
MSQALNAVVVPQFDVNDVEMELVAWSVRDGDRVEAGEDLCTLETAKATHGLASEVSGVVRRAAGVNVTVRVGEVIAWVGASLEAIEAALADGAPPAGSSGPSGGGAEPELRITGKARALLEEHGLEASAVPRAGSVLKEKDVRRHLEDRAARSSEPPVGALPAALAPRVERLGPPPRHLAAVARQLAEARRELIFATVEVEVLLDGRRTGDELLSTVVHAVGHSLADFPAFAGFVQEGELYRYRAVDLAVTLRDENRGGRLVAPVLRGVDGMDLPAVASRVAELRRALEEGSLTESDLSGAALTVTALGDLPVTRFTALQDRFQSAALAVGAPSEAGPSTESDAASRRSVALTLSYDHALADAFSAGAFLAAVADRMSTSAP